MTVQLCDFKVIVLGKLREDIRYIIEIFYNEFAWEVLMGTV